MSNIPKDVFTLRQTMFRSDLECYHYCDASMPEVDFHQHPFYEILFFLSGSVSYIIEGRTYQLRPGDILLIDSQDIHRPEVQSGKTYERYVIWVAPQVIDQIRAMGTDLASCFQDAKLRRHKLIRPDSASLAKLKSICEKMLRARDEEAFGRSTLVQTYLVEFLIYLNRAYFATPETIRQDITENALINEAASYINDHLAEDLSLDRISGALYVSKSHLSRSFKEFTGLTLYQYIIKKRLMAARNMLLAGRPVMEACMKCGFNDYSNFLKAFKREFGKSPKEFMSRES